MGRARCPHCLLRVGGLTSNSDITMALCAGCGDNLTGRQSDRRSLETPAAAKVVKAWRDILYKLGREGKERELSQRSGNKMCRGCYSSYERFTKLIEAKLMCMLESDTVSTEHESNKRKLLSSPGLTTPKAKRVRHQSSTRHCHHRGKPSSSLSPSKLSLFSLCMVDDCLAIRID